MTQEQPPIPAPSQRLVPLDDSESARSLLARCQQGDQVAWSRIISMHAGLVYSIARHHDLSEDRCDDIAQLVFTALLKHAGKIRDPVALPAWLAQTTRRACWRLIDRTRREHAALQHLERAAAVLATGEQDTPRSAELLARLEQAHAMRIALDDLGGRCRDLLRALFVDATSPDYDAIGRRLGMPVGSIGPTRVRCLAKLASLLQADQTPTESSV